MRPIHQVSAEDAVSKPAVKSRTQLSWISWGVRVALPVVGTSSQAASSMWSTSCRESPPLALSVRILTWVEPRVLMDRQRYGLVERTGYVRHLGGMKAKTTSRMPYAVSAQTTLETSPAPA